MNAEREHILIAVPSLHGSVTCATANLFSAAQQRNFFPGKYKFSATTVEGIRGYAAARNNIAQLFLSAVAFDRLWMIDDDIKPGNDAFGILDVDADIVAPVMPTMNMKIDNNANRLDFSFPICAFRFDDLDDIKTMHTMKEPFDRKDLDKHDAMEVDAVGFGCTVISRRVFTHPGMDLDGSFIRADGSKGKLTDGDVPAVFQTRYLPNGITEFGEDVDYCYRAKKAGFSVKLHTGIRVGHAMEADCSDLYDISEFWKAGAGSHNKVANAIQ